MGCRHAATGTISAVILLLMLRCRCCPLRCPLPSGFPRPLLCSVSGLEGIREQRHRLDAAGSPLLRALPDYQRQFQEHLLQANARHEASQQR